MDLISHAPTNNALLNYHEAHVIIRAWAENCSGDKEPTTVATSLRLYGLRQVVVLRPPPQRDTNRCYQTTPPSLGDWITPVDNKDEGCQDSSEKGPKKNKIFKTREVSTVTSLEFVKQLESSELVTICFTCFVH